MHGASATFVLTRNLLIYASLASISTRAAGWPTEIRQAAAHPARGSLHRRRIAVARAGPPR